MLNKFKCHFSRPQWLSYVQKYAANIALALGSKTESLHYTSERGTLLCDNWLAWPINGQTAKKSRVKKSFVSQTCKLIEREVF